MFTLSKLLSDLHADESSVPKGIDPEIILTDGVKEYSVLSVCSYREAGTYKIAIDIAAYAAKPV